MTVLLPLTYFSTTATTSATTCYTRIIIADQKSSVQTDRDPDEHAKTMFSRTSIFNGEPRHAQRGVRSECQEETVTTALYPLRGLVALETCKQRPIRVFALVDVQEVVTRLHVETGAIKKEETKQNGETQVE